MPITVAQNLGELNKDFLSYSTRLVSMFVHFLSYKQIYEGNKQKAESSRLTWFEDR